MIHAHLILCPFEELQMHQQAAFIKHGGAQTRGQVEAGELADAILLGEAVYSRALRLLF